MDLCLFFFGLFVVLAVVTLVGHGIWVVLTYVFKGMPAHAPMTDPVSRELDDLNAAIRQVRRLSDRGDLGADTAERVIRCLSTRRRALQGVGWETRPEPAKPVASPRQQLEELLGSVGDLRDLSGVRRQQALACYRQLSGGELADLSPRALAMLARLLAVAGLASRALEVCRLFLDRYPVHPGRGAVALQAGRLARVAGDTSGAIDFLEQALEADLPAKSRQEAQEALDALRLSVPVAELVEPEPEKAPALPAPPPEPPPRVRAEPPMQPRPSRVTAAAPPARRAAWTDMLAAFMEERNILWGELVGGLLIVGCSIALVITLWHTLENLPYFPFLIFSAITAGLFGAGKYTLHHWKLDTTSRGLLVIALLLVPLNLLALADPSCRDVLPESAEYAVKFGVLAAFALLVRFAASDLLPAEALPGPIDRRWLLAGAIVATAGSPLLLSSLWDLQHLSFVLLLAGLPILCYLLAGGAVLLGLVRARRGEPGEKPAPLDPAGARALLLFLGPATFAALVALGFVIARGADHLGSTLDVLAFPLALVGVPLLVGGLLIYRRVSEEAGERIAGTATALLGVTLMVAPLALAWPVPGMLFLIALLDGLVLTALAYRWALRWAHAAALPCFVLTYLLLFHVLAGNLALFGPAPAQEELATLLVSSKSGTALVVPILLLLLLSEGLVRAGRWTDAIAHAWGGGAVAVAALGMVSVGGLDHPGRAAFLYLVCAGCAGLANLRCRRLSLVGSGAGLAILGILWALHAWAPERYALWAFVLAVESAAASVATLGLRALMAGEGETAGDASNPIRQLRITCAWTAMATGILSLGVVWLASVGLAPSWHTWTALALAVSACGLAREYEQPGLAGLASLFLLAALAHLCIYDLTTLQSPWLFALLGHATIALGLAWTVRDERAAVWFTDAFRSTGIVTSFVAVPLILLPGDPALARAGFSLWLAVLWLGLALPKQHPGWFTGHQVALTAAALFAVTAWVERQPWYSAFPPGLFDPRALQSDLFGLGLLSLGWVVVRQVTHTRFRWEGIWWDRAVLVGSILAQLALAGAGVVPGILAELGPDRPPFSDAWLAGRSPALGMGAWLVLGVYGVVLLVALRLNRRPASVVGLAALSLVIPFLVAGRFADERAVASALRWTAGLWVVAVSALVWGRSTLAALAGKVALRPAEGMSAGAWTRRLTLLGVACVLLLTFVVAGIGFSGLTPGGPTSSSLFARMGWVVSNVVPLGLVAFGLAGHAIRERSPGYAFAAGLVANLAVTGGRALAVVLAGGELDLAERIRLVQWAGLTAGLWAVGWLVIRERLKRPVESPLARPLLWTQLALALGCSAFVLVLAPWHDLNLLVHPDAWCDQAGSLSGWLAFAAGLLALGTWHGQRALLPRWEALFAAGVGLVLLLACTAGVAWPGEGYRLLLLAGGGYALLWAAVPVLLPASAHPEAVARVWRSGSCPGLEWGVGLLNALLLCVALRGFAEHRGLFIPATVLLPAAAWGVLGLARRSEGLALLSALTTNLAVSLFVERFYREGEGASWFLLLAVANVAAWAAGALMWQGLRRRFPDWGRPGVVFVGQCVLALGANTLLLLVPLAALLARPEVPLAPAFAPLGEPLAWLALLLAAGAVWGLEGNTDPRVRLSILAIAGLSAGVLLAALVRPWDEPGRWLSFHVLVAAWSALGLLALVLGTLRPPRGLLPWLQAGPVFLLPLGLRAAGADPREPYTSAGPVLLASFLLGAVAVRQRRSVNVYLSGLLLNLAAVLCWWAWGPWTWTGFVLINACILGIASVGWSLINRAYPPGFSVFPQVAGLLALGLLACVVGVTMLADLAGMRGAVEGPFAWSALGCVGAALFTSLWDPEARLACPGLYLLGLLVVGLGLHFLDVNRDWMGWYGMLALAGHVALAAGVARAPVASLLRLPHREGFPGRCPGLHSLAPSGQGEGTRPPRRGEGVQPGATPRESWFVASQVLVAGLVLALGARVALVFPTFPWRLGAPLASAVLALGAWLHFLGGRTDRQRYTMLALVTIAVVQMCWAWPDPAGAHPWFLRNALTFAALVGLTGLVVITLPRVPEWREVGRRYGLVLAGVSFAVLLVLLGQEFALYDRTTRHTPLALWATVAVLLAGVGLLAVLLRYALEGDAGTSERRRTVYVYAAEVLLLLLFLHLRFNVPELFSGWMGKYWTVIVMLIAFLGVGLAEVFERGRLPVLAQPLAYTGMFLPLVPVLAFWVRPPGFLVDFAGQHAPGLHPMLSYLDRLPWRFDVYAVVWLLAGALYGALALSRQSFRFALVGALAANAGLWSLLAHQGVAFLVHPQFWLIPLALIILVSEHVHRDQLRHGVSAGLRYLGISMIYVASTADLFLAGVGNSWVWPVILAVLAVTGVLAGILLRVRAFLFLGVSFLFVDVFAMIWHAAVDNYQTWVWWASGIVLGVAILMLFAVFEKRRNDVLQLIEDLKRWD